MNFPMRNYLLYRKTQDAAYDVDESIIKNTEVEEYS